MGTRIFLLTILFLVDIYSCTDITYRVLEGRPAGHFIGNIALDSNLSSEVSESDFPTLRYSLLSTGDTYVSLFTLNQTSGNLYTTDEIDREDLCPFSVDCELTLEAAVQSNIRSFFKKFSLSIFIDDINDNSPIFPKPSLDLTIPESTLVGTSLTILGAKDADTSQNYSLQLYEIEEANTPFSISFVKNLDGTSIVKLVVDGELDREVRDNYHLTVVAKDGGSPPNTGRLTVNVNISDVNDNAPMLSSSIYNVSIQEDTPVGTVILTLKANDLDLGVNAEISYRLSPHQSNSIKLMFAIDEISGNLSIQQPVLYNDGNPYRVIVEASDNGDQPLTTQTFVMVTVLDTGNSPPEIHINSLSNTDVAHVSELATVGAVVAHVVVVDTDSGLNGYVTCFISNENFDLHRLDVNEYKVILSRPLDREVADSHTVTVDCQDAGSPPLESRAAFIVVVTDVNDSPPMFNQPIYNAVLTENNEIGAEIIRVSATDRDEGENAEIRYQLLQNNDSVVQVIVDPVSGRITADKSFDRETDPYISFSVIAYDGGSPPQFGTATVSVQIGDVNDETPQFIENLFIFKITEKKSPGTVVGRLLAHDFDSGDNGKFVFTGDTSNVPFQVYQDGFIKTSQILDREEGVSYDFPVKVTDLGNPPRSSVARVNIFIADENDNSPVFLYPNSRNNSVKVSQFTTPGTIIARVHAVDPDEGRNGEITYGIGGINESEIFQVNFHTGDIIVKTSLEAYTGQHFLLNLFASDHGIDMRTSTTTLTIVVSSTSDSVSIGQNNLIIVVVIVIVTVVLSAAIIVTIVLIKWLDERREARKRAGGKIESNFSDIGNTNMELQNGHIHKQNGGHSNGPDPEKRIKEVTFALSQNGVADIQVDNEHVIENPCYGQGLGPSSLLKQHEDNHSETSGETTNSDSGRGLSDDEIHIGKGMLYHTRKDKLRMNPEPLNLQSRRKPNHSFFPEGRLPLSPIDHPPFALYQWNGTGYKLPNHENVNQTFSFGNRSPMHDGDDSGSTSGIHTMEEIPMQHMRGNVV